MFSNGIHRDEEHLFLKSMNLYSKEKAYNGKFSFSATLANFKEQRHRVGLNIDTYVHGWCPSYYGWKWRTYSIFYNNDKKNVLISFYCILNQQNLCAKAVILNDTLHKVVNIVNYIRTNVLMYRQFWNILMIDDEAINVDLTYLAKVH